MTTLMETAKFLADAVETVEKVEGGAGLFQVLSARDEQGMGV